MAFQASNYTGSLAPADFRGAVFTGAHFQEIAQMSSLCNFHYISEGISFPHAFLVSNDLGAADLVHADFCHTMSYLVNSYHQRGVKHYVLTN